jgi:hypothetical protein
MKWIDSNVLLLLSVFTSCSDSIDLVDPVEPSPVIYFLMNPDDSVFYLTLTRTFTGNSNAFDLARDADRLFYDNADIRLEAWTDQFKVQETQFKPSDRTKIPGTFAEGPEYCYEAANEFYDIMEPITSFRIVLTALGMTTPVVSRIPVLNAPKAPTRYNHVIGLYPNGYKYPPERNSPCVLKYGQAVGGGGGIKYQQLLCEFNYQEYEGKWIDHSVTFTLRKNTLVVEPFLYPDFFFTKVAASIKPINDTITRKFISLDLIFLSGDQYYKDYVDTYEHDGNLDLLPKGNIINGYGLFTMIRVARYQNMTLDQESLDSLSMGRITRKLKFVRW